MQSTTPLSSQEGVLVEPQRAILDREALLASNLRSGMWVRLPDQSIGILTGCSAAGQAQVTLTKPDGTTKMVLDASDKAVPAVVTVAAQTLVQANIEDIPYTRRPDVEALRVLGYKHRSEA
jgi:hypothetical protein